ncbi:6-bladed beta-propeller [Chitinophaga rhizosphaerae]|uniref:6-bladed beta-propeller n=1 Tax=Chitinophaga rhizosphaerae TaxID=1864947 RepID=UPI000F807703|nr:6-bladed beta-propeller [Chitinophaga rhizosphaerae]
MSGINHILRKFWAAAATVLAFTGAHAQAGKAPVLRIDPSRAYGGNISDFFSDITFIPLETTRESLFGDIGKLIVTDSSFVIADMDTRSTLFFRTNGRFAGKVKWPANVMPEIKYDRSAQVIQVYYIHQYDAGKKSLVYYSLKGQPIPAPRVRNSIYPQGHLPLGQGYSLRLNSCRFGKGTQPKDSIFYLAEIYKGDVLYKRLLPYNQRTKTAFCYLFGKVVNASGDFSGFIVQDGVTYMATAVENLVYRVTKDTAVPVCQVVFPMNTAYPQNVLQLKDTRLLDSVTAAAKPVGTIMSISKIFYNKRKLFFKGESPYYLSYRSTGANSIYNFVYDTLSHQLVSLERLAPDAGSGFLPAFDPRDGLMINGIYQHGGRIYSYVSSLDMFNARDKTKDKHPQYPPVLQDYFKKQTRKSNPVLVSMKLKE